MPLRRHGLPREETNQQWGGVNHPGGVEGDHEDGNRTGADSYRRDPRLRGDYQPSILQPPGRRMDTHPDRTGRHVRAPAGLRLAAPAGRGAGGPAGGGSGWGGGGWFGRKAIAGGGGGATEGAGGESTTTESSVPETLPGTAAERAVPRTGAPAEETVEEYFEE